MVPLHRGSVDDFEREPPRARLLRHHERSILEVRLVHLHNALKNMGFLGQVSAEQTEPMTYAGERESREGLGLLHGNGTGPTPQDHPECGERNLAVGEPCVREERESAATCSASVSFTVSQDLTAPALRTPHAFAEQSPSQELFNLWITGYLVECVHVHILADV